MNDVVFGRQDRSGQVFSLVVPLVGLPVGSLGEDELGDASAHFQFDPVVNFEQSFAASFVAGVPDGGVEHTGVPEERRAWQQKPDVAVGDPNDFGVPDDVSAGG